MSALEDSAIESLTSLQPALPASSSLRGALRQIPFRVAVMMRLPGLRLCDLRALQAGAVLLTQTSAADDVPVFVGGAVLGHAELDNVDGQMAIRLTRLSEG